MSVEERYLSSLTATVDDNIHQALVDRDSTTDSCGYTEVLMLWHMTDWATSRHECRIEITASTATLPYLTASILGTRRECLVGEELFTLAETYKA